MPYRGSTFKLLGTVFSKVEKEKREGRYYETVTKVIGELIPLDISMGCTASKLSIPIPASPAIRIRMGFQGPTLHIIAYLHSYDLYDGQDVYDKLIVSNWYDAWLDDVNIEDLIKVSSTTDNIAPSGFGDAVTMDGGSVMSDKMPSGYSAQPLIKPGTYWWVRKRELIHESGWGDKYRLELDLERSWQWSTSGRQRPSYDTDQMECFKDGEIGYIKITTEYSE